MRLIYPVLIAAVLAASPVVAQPAGAPVPPAPPNKVFANVNFGFQSQSQDFGQRAEFSIYDEPGSFETQHAFKGGSSFDIGGGVRVWQNLSVGLSFNQRAKHSRDVTVTANVPSPIFTDTLRGTSGTLSGLEHTERAVHLQALWHVPVTVEFDVTLFAGPTFFSVEDDLVDGITTAEVGGNFSSVNLGSIGRTNQSNKATGFHVGLDTRYMFMKNVGAGAMLRYSNGSFDLALPANNVGPAVKLDAGGLEIAAGLRFKF